MKILMVSIFAPHFFNWTEQLKDSGHEVYWLDVFDSNTRVEQIDFVDQIIGWRYKRDYPGRYYIKKEVPKLNKFINKFNERDLAEIFESKIQEIKPDVVHSFVMFLSCVPVFEVMKKYPQIKWIYSSWGSDLYFYQNRKKELADIKKVLPHIDYLFADCYRDYKLALNFGFRGKLLGVFPGRGGFDFKKFDIYIKMFENRKSILIKGYQDEQGRCITILDAITQLRDELKEFNIIVFGANSKVEKYVAGSDFESWDNLIILKRIHEFEVLKLMGESLIYIGNSISDGMPNTLLESIIMGAFPIQSNPGGATAELIEHQKNGFLIQDPLDVNEIKSLILRGINDKAFLAQAVEYNFKQIKPKLEREFVRQEVLKKYSLVEKAVKS